MTPSQWNRALAADVGWQEAYAAVEHEARKFLSMPAARVLQRSTAEIVECLYPHDMARSEGITARRRLFKALMALATHGLADCCTKGEPRKVKHGNRMVRPWLWHAPKLIERCDKCGRPL